ncbi:MAG TPA: hypothetical protein VM012_14970, partial [Flavitalea sp.]|nr:hypothetical protein [Flavitalea sp.]
MRKKGNKVTLLIAGTIIMLTVICALVPATSDQQIDIQAPLGNVSISILNLEKWKLWHPALKKIRDTSIFQQGNSAEHLPFINAGNLSIAAKKISPYGIYVEEKQKNKTIFFSFFIIPKNGEQNCTIILRKKTSFLEAMYSKILHRNTSDNPLLLSLKEYVEKPAKYYGF